MSVLENCLDTPKGAAVGPTQAGFFLTSKVIDGVPGLCTSPLGVQVREILVASEASLFRPLLCSTGPSDFPSVFRLFANRYFPVRIQAMFLILSQIENVEKFRADYFENAPKIACSLAMHSGRWGLKVDEVVSAFGQYFETALKIVSVSPYVSQVPVSELMRLLTAMTELDYGFTAMGLVFEGSIKAPEAWRVSEVFQLTRRSLLDYEDATNKLLLHLDKIKPGQANMFAEPRESDRQVVSMPPRGLGQAGKHLRTIGNTVEWPEDVDSDYE